MTLVCGQGARGNGQEAGVGWEGGGGAPAGREGGRVMNYTVYNCSINDLAPKPSRGSPGCPHSGSDGEIPLTYFLAPRTATRVFIQ